VAAGRKQHGGKALKIRYRQVFAAFGVILCLTACGQKDAPPQPGEQAAPNAKSLQKSPVEITSKSGVKMRLIPGGEFIMGSSSGAEDETPPHRVTVSGFAMDVFEVTQDQYAAFEWPNPAHFKDPRRPVEQVRWSDAALFCNERSRREGLDPCYDEVTFECHFDASGYRLPTEAEWEYAARAGTETDYDFGNDPRELQSHANFGKTSNGRTGLAGMKKPNRWGLYDMCGNVYEWCHDVYDPAYYAASPGTDPYGPASGEKRVLRGGAWNSSPVACRAPARYSDAPGITDACFARDTYGFRAVRPLSPEEETGLLVSDKTDKPSP
jgi:formylglycine-generating enzyme required for sulfatase activity